MLNIKKIIWKNQARIKYYKVWSIQSKLFSHLPIGTFICEKVSLEKRDNIFVGSNCLCQYEGRSDPKVPLGLVAFAKYLAYITMEPN